ncbi:phosphotransferase family protein [Kitasatospora viridis]|uniref:Phosphotransferase family enzyme n=1 Tax=Kitasatospora viridis TaxID=281105 RepID=A0A561UQ96_9ACTN|nr:phosphotransferase [Kitasatospora viridis]TWG01557.1 phosphotransferase family enzyme [Kitasatospora viridis]
MDDDALRGPLARAVTDALGGGLLDVRRLRGGSKKGVLRLELAGGESVIAYLWSAAEDHWPQADRDAAERDPLGHASGLDLFEAAHRRLDSLGVRTPRLLHADRSHRRLPADLALVEDLPRGSLELMLDQEPERAEPVVDRLAGTLAALHADTAPAMGKVGAVERLGQGGREGGQRGCEHVVLERALADLAEAAGREPRLAAVRPRLEELLRERAAAVRPRSRFRLIHGELGPDHVLVDREDRPALIDIEGLMYFDVEWEHVFLRIRFHERHDRLATVELDPARLALYRPAMRLSLVAGPLRLLDGAFPGDREAMRAIAEHNLRRLLDEIAPLF